MLRDRRHDAHARRVRDERDVRLFRQRRDGEGRRRQRRAEDRDRMLVDELPEIVDRSRRVGLIVEDRQRDRMPVDAAGLVDLVDGHLHAVGLGPAERRTGSAQREDRSDHVRLGGRSGARRTAGREREQRRRGQCTKTNHERTHRNEPPRVDRQ
jgi:hypothetical protein